MDMQELTLLLFILKENKTSIENELDQVKLEISGVESKLIDAMLESGQDKASFPEIGSISLTTQNFPSIKNEELFFNFLEDTKQDGMIKRTVNSNTLRGWWNALSEELDASEIGLEVFTKPRINSRRS